MAAKSNFDNPTPEIVQREIEALLAHLADSWARGDAKAYGELFCEEAQYVEAPGRRVRGRAAIAQSHQRSFDTFFKHTRIASGPPASDKLRQTLS